MPTPHDLIREFTRRRFVLSCLVITTSTIALFTGFMDDSIYLGVITAVLGLYGAAAWKGVK